MVCSHVRHAALAVMVLTTCLAREAAAAPFNYTFDVDAQGWSAISSGASEALIYEPGGGNPGGFIAASRTEVPTLGTGTITSNLGVIGPISLDATSYGGTLSFDTKIVSADTALFGAALGFIVLQAGQFEFVRALSGPLKTSFSTVSLALDPSASWLLMDAFNPAAQHLATDAEFLAFLPQVTGLIIMESYQFLRGTGGTMTLGFDNIRLTDPTPPATVPEPATLTLLALGLVGIGARRHRRR